MSEQEIIDRQHARSSNEEEREIRVEDASKLIHDIIGRNAEFFADSNNRLEFVKGQTAESFFTISQYINAKLRGEKPHELRRREDEKLGGSLPGMHTPNYTDKPLAFSRGFDAIQEYLSLTTDSTEKQIEGIAMATEALIIWVHPFYDGNGRTSRFMAKLIEEGATDIDTLVQETTQSRFRKATYYSKYLTKEDRLADANNEDIIFEDDDERDEMRKTAENLPPDTEGMYLSIKRLLGSDEVRERSAKNRPGFAKAA